MKARRLAYAPEAEAQLLGLYRYIAERGSPAAARRFTDAIMMRCEELADAPLIGRLREDIRPNLRLWPYRRRVMIAYDLDAEVVTILGIFYGGQDFELLLRPDDNEAE